LNPERYSRQRQLKAFGANGQRALESAAVLVVGAGGLGIPVCQYLNAMGIGKLGIIDGDIVEISNLHRQPAYGPDDLGAKKVGALGSWLQNQNPDTQLALYDYYLSVENVLDLFPNFNLIVDATDNLATRYLIDDACVMLDLPWVYGALHGFEGQVSVFNFNGGPTYRCVFPNLPQLGEIPDCNTMGTLGVLPGIIGNFQALEATKVIANLPGILSGVIMMYQGQYQEIHHLKISRNPDRYRSTSQLSAADYVCEPGQGAITIQDFKEKHGSMFEGILIDVREPHEFEADRIPGAKNIPLLTLKEQLSKIEGNPTLILYCRSGARSRQGFEIVRLNYPERDVKWLNGGIMEYNRTLL
jgi:adenylyltransferase/sulfurtransferase